MACFVPEESRNAATAACQVEHTVTARTSSILPQKKKKLAKYNRMVLMVVVHADYDGSMTLSCIIIILPWRFRSGEATKDQKD